tara:strand:- start:3033 stop:3281 length:249 start_codon:yes stop_codon:yes gene_type:complete
MAEDEQGEVMEEETEKGNKKYVTATLDKTADAKLIQEWSRLQKLAGFGSRDLVEAGVKALKGSDEYKQAIQSVKEDIAELEG